MNNSTKILLGLLVIVVGWHIVMAMSAKVSVSGPFLVKPAEAGYVWSDAENAESRFFWQNIGVKWVTGVAHPEFKAETTQAVGSWQAMPGYAFVDKRKSLETVWKSGLLHPAFMAWSDDMEGKWIPVTGYRFIYDGDTFVESVWDPNKRYDDLKVISLAQKDQYKPFPGYTFIEPGQSLKVIWTPGTINTDNTRLIAGAKEGSWVVNSQPRQRSGSDGSSWVARRIGERLIDRAIWRAF
ncbi:hypothetical protein GO730_21345 [Spirosoma sp. HMF3257]|uniref:Uncharacterized protein n=1 Tax=Spirosoma telluris TaxID=2183553 RepID=A0A327NL23_9BACT|nr:hypothetical protein [Spirosoma telluris]RAI76080.1 hypothetical protein HMF3257_21265 [Spirosoma telluris]